MKRSLILGGTPCIAISVVILIIRNARNGARMQGTILENDILPKSLREIVGSFFTETRKIQLQPWTWGTYFKFCGVAMGLWIAIIRAWNFDDDAICF